MSGLLILGLVFAALCVLLTVVELLLWAFPALAERLDLALWDGAATPRFDDDTVDRLHAQVEGRRTSDRNGWREARP